MALFHRTNIPVTEYGTDSEGQPAAGPRSAGDALRQQREALHRDLKDVASALRIKPTYLAALEEGRPDRLPGPAYAAGFVRAYGDHLGLDGAEILRRFRLEASGLDKKPDLSFPMPLGEKSVPGGPMLLVALILAVCGYGSWYYLSTVERSRPERITEVPVTLLPPKPETPAVGPLPAPPAANALVRSIGPAGGAPSDPASSPEAPAATEVSTAPNGSPPVVAMPIATPEAPVIVAVPNAPSQSVAASEPSDPGAGHNAGSDSVLGAESVTTSHTYGAIDGPVRIILMATVDSWIQVRDANRSVLFTGLLKPGERYRVPDRPGLSMRAGNAGGLNVTVDGKPAPPLGPTGAVRNVALDPESLAAKSEIHN
jgi:cytoskeleton protein RodZ